MSLITELLEMCSSEYEEMLKSDDTEKKYVDDEHAKEHAQEFIARAKEILHFNKKEGDEGEVNNLAKKFAKDYYDSIMDEIESFKYGSRKKGDEEEDMGGDDYEGMM